MVECKIAIINTTNGKRFLAVANYKSRTFKTELGAIKWAKKNEFKIVRCY